MGVAQFPLPNKIEHVIAIMNQKGLNITIHEYEGELLIYSGDQLQFGADNKEEVQAFLAGAFLQMFGGKELYEIINQVSSFSIELNDEIDDDELEMKLNKILNEMSRKDIENFESWGNWGNPIKVWD